MNFVISALLKKKKRTRCFHLKYFSNLIFITLWERNIVYGTFLENTKKLLHYILLKQDTKNI